MKNLVAVLLFFVNGFFVNAQTVLTETEAVNKALGNKRNLNAQLLALQQQRQLLTGAYGFANPEVSLERSPYEPLLLSVEQQFQLPRAYQANRAVQQANVRVAERTLQLNEQQIKRTTRSAYLQLQYFEARTRQLEYQDSLYHAVKVSSQRSFAAGQINKMEELFAANQADKVHNDLIRSVFETRQQKKLLQILANYLEDFTVEPLREYPGTAVPDTVAQNPQLRLLQEQTDLARRQLAAQKAQNLPAINAGLLFPLSREYEVPLGYRLGVTLPIWWGQNKAQIAAAQTGVEVANAQREVQQQDILTDFFNNRAIHDKERQSLTYFRSTALPQAEAIMEAAQRLFAAGQMNYIEMLRNVITAFENQTAYLESIRNHNQAVIELEFLMGKL